MKLSLSKKITFFVEVCILISIIFTIVVVFIFSERLIKEEVDARLMGISYLKGEYVKQYLNFRVQAIENAANSMHIRDQLTVLSKAKNSETQTLNILTDGMIDMSDVLDLSIINKDGTIVASNNRDEVGKIKSSEPYFLDAKEHTTVKSFNYDITTKKIVTIIATPLKDIDGNFFGILVEKNSNTEINNLMSNRLGLGETGETYLINLSHFTTTSLLKEPDLVLKEAVYLPPVNACLQKNSNLYLSADYHGDIVFGYARWFPEIESCIITKIDKSEILKPMFQILPQILALIVIIFLVVLISGYFLSQSMLKPLNTLRNQVIKIKDGDMDVSIEPTSNDEIGDVAISFREMFIKLKDLYKNLEQKVEERTDKLKSSEHKLQEALGFSERNNKMMVNRELDMIKLKKELSELKNK